MKAPPPPFTLKITGKSRDGMVVTLGKYRTQAEADADHARLVKEGYYSNVQITELPPPPVDSSTP